MRIYYFGTLVSQSNEEANTSPAPRLSRPPVLIRDILPTIPKSTPHQSHIKSQFEDTPSDTKDTTFVIRNYLHA